MFVFTWYGFDIFLVFYVFSMRRCSAFLSFLARLLILIKKVGYWNWSSAASALTFTIGRDNLKSFSCILSKFVLHVTNDQFSGKFNNG